MTNQVKTFLLLAGLTVFLVFMGNLIGGRGGMYIAFIIALAMNFFSYWFSDKIVLRMYGAQEVSPAEAPELHRMVEELSYNAGIPKPRVYIIPDESPNAFATGRNPQHASVAFTEGLLKRTFEAVAKEYPDLEAQHIIVDNCAHQLVKKPEQFDVIVTTNMNGDIISDLSSGLIGGLGFAPSANIGSEVAIFEAVHGSAPKYAGKNSANPTALILSGVMMLRHMGELEAARLELEQRVLERTSAAEIARAQAEAARLDQVGSADRANGQVSLTELPFRLGQSLVNIGLNLIDNVLSGHSEPQAFPGWTNLAQPEPGPNGAGHCVSGNKWSLPGN